MAEKHGGARPGAGRPKKDRPPGNQKFESAESYLRAVVCGEAEPDSVRVQAARTLIQYEQKKCRAPKASPAPQKMELKEARAAESEAAAAFEAVAQRIRAKHGRA